MSPEDVATAKADYTSGKKTVPEISRFFGVGERYIYQLIAADPLIKKRGKVKSRAKTPLSKVHESIGRHLYDYYFGRSFDRRLAANALNWNSLKLRNVEQGLFDLTLFDLLDIATFTRTTVGDLLNGR